MALIFEAPVPMTLDERLVAGPSHHYTMQTRSQIPGQWMAYNDAHLRVPSPHPDDYFGIAYGQTGDMEFDYLCGQDIAPGTALPTGFTTVTLPGGAWAKFATQAHISTMSDGWGEVMGHWMHQPGLRFRPGPMVEYYPPAFNGMTGLGGYELWVPTL